MTFSLLPDVILNSVTDITVSQLNRHNIRLLMLDFDNTILPYTASVPTEAIVRWLREVQDAGIGLCVISNSKKERVKVFCQKYGLDCVTHARKPSPQDLLAHSSAFSLRLRLVSSFLSQPRLIFSLPLR